MTDKKNRFLPAWDPVLRFLHWWNALTMTLMLFTGAVFIIAGHDMKEAAEIKLTMVHAVFGFLLGAGIFARVLWLFMGTETARWRDMLPLSSEQSRVFGETIRYYIRGLKGEPPLYFAHNPFAGIIYLGFFVIACVQVVSGAVFLNLPESLRDKSVSHEFHELGFLLILIFIAAHLAAVFIHELKERHGLISAMVHGKKTFTDEEAERISESHPQATKGETDER